MRQGCEIVNLGGNSTAIICGGEPTNHVCNEDGVVYETIDGNRHFFENLKDSHAWYVINYESVRSGSVACSICQRAVIDNAMWL